MRRSEQEGNSADGLLSGWGRVLLCGVTRDAGEGGAVGSKRPSCLPCGEQGEQNTFSEMQWNHF